MDGWMKSAEELASVIMGKGYGIFNFQHGRIGVDFRTGISAHLTDHTGTGFPINAVTAIRATQPDEPYTVATFRIGLADGGVQVERLTISMYENVEGGLRDSLSLEVKSPEGIPAKAEAVRLIEDKWEKRCQENKERQHRSVGRRKGI